MAAAPNSPGNIMQTNAIMRAALLQSAPRMRKLLGNFTQGGSLGGTTRVKLFNVGITTKLIIDVVATVDIAVATATLSPKAPFNLINRVKLTDYDGTDRVNCSGYQLWVAQCVRNEAIVGYNNQSQTAVLTSPLVPTAVAAGSTFRFQLEVPLAYSDTDLRGALLTQTAVGEAYLNLDWNTLFYQNGNADAVLNGAATTTASNVSINVNVEQEFLLPQNVGGQVPLPAIDLMTVYELAGALKSADNLAVNSEKLINYPNVRSVIGAYFNYVNNGIMNAATTDVSKLRLIANGNNVLREYSATSKLFDQRRFLTPDGDIRAGTYFESHRARPIETALYGNVQYGFTPSAVTTTTYAPYLEVMFESFYTKGSTLPGLSQASG